MTAAPLASIIIDNYNYSRFLKDAIESALDQTYPNVEVIVVDDGSTDNSADVIQGYGGRVTSILKQNGGQGSAFNAGFRASHGEVILFLDSDDVLLPKAVESAMPFFQDPEVVKVHWPLRVVDENLSDRGKLFPESLLPAGDFRALVARNGPALTSSPTSGNAWVRSFLAKVLPLEEATYRSAAEMYLFELAPFFGALRRLDEPQSLYRQHGSNFYFGAQAVEAKIQREVAYYDGVCRALIRLLRVPEERVAEWQRGSWAHRDARALQALNATLEPNGSFILVDDATWDLGPIGGRERIPFLEHEGRYWGPASDDAEAIAQVQRLRRNGASAIAFVWQAFWWLETFRGFDHYLRTNFRCLHEDDCVVIFDLR